MLSMDGCVCARVGACVRSRVCGYKCTTVFACRCMHAPMRASHTRLCACTHKHTEPCACVCVRVRVLSAPVTRIPHANGALHSPTFPLGVRTRCHAVRPVDSQLFPTSSPSGIDYCLQRSRRKRKLL